jgi:hypothetical protein
MIGQAHALWQGDAEAIEEYGLSGRRSPIESGRGSRSARRRRGTEFVRVLLWLAGVPIVVIILLHLVGAFS